jgi:hypothetical protein
MKKFWIALAVCLAVAAPIVAPFMATAHDHRKEDVQQHAEYDMKKIKEGEASGQLTPANAEQLEQAVKDVEHDDHHVDHKKEEKLNRDLRRDSLDIEKSEEQ